MVTNALTASTAGAASTPVVPGVPEAVLMTPMVPSSAPAALNWGTAAINPITSAAVVTPGTTVMVKVFETPLYTAAVSRPLTYSTVTPLKSMPALVAVKVKSLSGPGLMTVTDAAMAAEGGITTVGGGLGVIVARAKLASISDNPTAASFSSAVSSASTTPLRFLSASA